MTERRFKIGDRVRCERHPGWRSVTGTVKGYSGKYMKFCPDAGVRYPNGDLVPDRYRSHSDHAGMDDTAFDLIKPEANELAELRAFKEAALASGYVPPETVDPDEIGVKLIYDRWLEDVIGDTDEAIREAIRWARANPR